jgi:L-ascorbate metabolism protein UlaG (beta-lactamase superfamily)
LIKYIHACVRLDDGERRVLIDPGVWTEPEAYDGITDILVTHEHADHLDVAYLASLLESRELRVFAPESVRAIAAQENAPAVAAAVSPVAAGGTVSAGGFAVMVVGGEHAETYEGLPGCANVGFIVEGVYHPGDSFFLPAQPVATLLVPASRPWFTLRAALDFTRAVAPVRAFPIHDRMLSTDVGFDLIDGWMQARGQTDYARIPLGDAATV